MQKTIQRSTLETLLVTHGGDFGSAYAELAEQAGDAVVSETLAEKWAKDFTRREAQQEGKAQLARVIGGQGLAVKAADFAQLDRDKKLDALGEEFLTFSHALISDHAHETFEPKERVTGIPKVAELLGLNLRVQSRRSGPQQAHREVPHIASTFGSLTDRQVLALYVREGQNVDYLTSTLMTLDPSLSFLTPETVAEKLKLWKRDGVVMDAEGVVVEWDEAIAGLQVQLRTLEGVAT